MARGGGEIPGREKAKESLAFFRRAAKRSLAIHNVPGASVRARALREAARVLNKGGKLVIADIRNTGTYASELEGCGLKITERRSLGVRFWFAADPWAATRLVAAIKP